MCTVFLALGVIPEWPLVAANNRDEFLSRPALAPRVYRGRRGGYYLASHDLTAGGSWWGLNDRGLLVFLTNRWVGEEYAPARRSRGELVLRALETSGVEELRARLEGDGGFPPPEDFNPYNLAAVSRSGGFFYSNFPEPHFLPLADGYHFLGNGPISGCGSLKAAAAARVLAACDERPSLAALSVHLSRALRTPLPHDTIPPQGFNVTFDGYGTTSSLLLALPFSRDAGLCLRYCPGNPLQSGYHNYDSFGRLLAAGGIFP